MKYLFYLLVLANLLFFLWKSGPQDTGGSSALVQELSIPSGGERIVLLREAPVLAFGPAKDKDRNGPPDEAGRSHAKTRKGRNNCFLVGPEPNQSEAESIRDLMTSHAPDASIITRFGDVPDGWWLLYPRALTPEIARQNRQMLADKGIRDTWIFENGPLQWGISLGLYDSLEKAEAAQKALAEKNIMLELTPRMIRGNVFWVKVPWRKPALELDEAVQVLNSQDPGIHIPAPVPCD